MSDEYGANSSKNDTLVDDSALEQNSGVGNVDNYANDASDTTASGGYGGTGDSFSDRSQRGLVDQSLDPGVMFILESPFKAVICTLDPLNPYGESGPGTPDNGEWKSPSDNDASRVAERRSEQWESKDGSGNDIGA
ncbi:hypothetical protein RhiJN_07641 [Ceratobasidium sp. AG-Ba]|nr:hypothetical protein RhiJN_07641 [Ceratobasidium sp. AG-Ba]QRW08486.1 hypothetical protein RhiLY_07485 [Ceratobasidium sp. AG-Ba]